MAGTIIVDHSVLSSTGKKVNSAAADYENQYTQLYKIVEGLGAAWQGADNKAFVDQINGFKQKFQDMSKIMKEYGEFLEKSAKLYADAQQQTITAASKLGK